MTLSIYALTRQAMARFMEKIRGNKVKFNTNKMVLTAGSTSANETLMFCLANPGDAFLIPAPYYPGYVYSFYTNVFKFITVGYKKGH